ncbi:MAG: Transcriptional regulator, GntR family domain / Aspartate aminotransferase, partial [uncultured Solirubrobacteraceae bacterium]
ALRGRPVHRHPLRGRAPADDARPRRRARQRRLRVLLLQDGVSRHPGGVPRRRPRPHQGDRRPGHEHVHRAEHGRPGDRAPLLRRRAPGARHRAGEGGAGRAGAAPDRRAGPRAARGALPGAGGRLLHVGRAPGRHGRRRAVLRGRRARRGLRQGHGLPARGRREHAAPGVLGRHRRADRRGRAPPGRRLPLPARGGL